MTRNSRFFPNVHSNFLSFSVLNKALKTQKIHDFKLNFIAFCDNPHATLWYVLHILTYFIYLIYLLVVYVLFHGDILLLIINPTIVKVYPGI